MDVFASRANAVEPLFITHAMNAWAFDWEQLCDQFGCLWMNPPFSQMGRVVVKCALEHAKAVVVVPMWQYTSVRPWQKLLESVAVRKVAVYHDEGGSTFVNEVGHGMPNRSCATDVYLLDARVHWTEPAEWPQPEVGWVKSQYQGLKGDELLELRRGRSKATLLDKKVVLKVDAACQWEEALPDAAVVDVVEVE